MNDSFPFSSTVVAALAPVVLPNLREARYLGDNISSTLADFGAGDQRRTLALYQTLQSLLAIVRDTMDDRERCLSELRVFVRQASWAGLVREVQQLGEASQRSDAQDVNNKVIHDIRGGGFQALSIMLQFIDFGVTQGDDLHRLFFLTRDHLKIMRNAVVDLDVEGYERDRRENLHNVELLTEKWQRAVHKVRGRAAIVQVDCQFDGNVSERCLEFAALDRVLYNLMNNAVRNTFDGDVYLVILPVPDQAVENLRFSIYNRVSPEQADVLRMRHGEKLGTLFHGGFTTGGTGLGMRICADFVTNAYGIRTVDAALEAGYIGARLMGDYFINWFHWPIAAD